MKTLLLPILLSAAVLFLQSCGMTRTERDIYTLTERDTITRSIVQNAPGDRDNGIVFPSSRTVEIHRDVTQRDSIVDRFYPNFIRLGVFESAGFIGTGAGKNGIGTGLFGVFGLFDPEFGMDVSGSPKFERNVTFTGGLYRFGIGEWRLRWFHDAENWTIGTSMLEILAPEARQDKMLISSFPIYLRKRYYLREEIPYVAVTPTFGLGYYPTAYLNLGATFDVGSIGGLNIRAYAGYAYGMNIAGYSPLVRDTTAFSSFPYAGIGVSVLDFLNRVPELYREWKDHEHSSWDVGLAQIGVFSSGADSSIFANKTTKTDIPIKGMYLRLANASVALPVLNHQLYLGTSLINLLLLGKGKGGIGLLPLRLGYWQTVLSDELSTEPFIEYNYFPSSFFHLGNRLTIRVSEQFNFSVLLGYASGSTTEAVSADITNQTGKLTDFSGAYIGIGFGISDRIFFPNQLRYNKK